MIFASFDSQRRGCCPYDELTPNSLSPCLQVADAATLLYCALTSLMTLLLQLATFYKYRRLSTAVRKRRRDDFLLLGRPVLRSNICCWSCERVHTLALVYTLLQFLLQLVLAFYTVGMLLLDSSSEWLKTLRGIHSYSSDILCLSGPVLLLLTRFVSRW